MKNRASSFLKQLFSIIVTMIKSKSMVVKSKTNSIKTRLAIFNLLHNKKLFSSTLNHKIHAIISGHELKSNNDREEAITTEQDDFSKALVLYNAQNNDYMDMIGEGDCDTSSSFVYDDGNGDDDDDNGDEEIVNGTDSVIEMVRGSKECGGEEFSLEDEIDHVADVFIKRFHRQMKMQKLESFKRYQEMLERSV